MDSLIKDFVIKEMRQNNGTLYLHNRMYQQYHSIKEALKNGNFYYVFVDDNTRMHRCFEDKNNIWFVETYNCHYYKDGNTYERLDLIDKTPFSRTISVDNSNETYMIATSEYKKLFTSIIPSFFLPYDPNPLLTVNPDMLYGDITIERRPDVSVIKNILVYSSPSGKFFFCHIENTPVVFDITNWEKEWPINLFELEMFAEQATAWVGPYPIVPYDKRAVGPIKKATVAWQSEERPRYLAQKEFSVKIGKEHGELLLKGNGFRKWHILWLLEHAPLASFNFLKIQQ